MAKEEQEKTEQKEKQKPERPKVKASDMDIKQLLIIVVIAAVIFGGIIVGGMYFFLSPTQPHAAAEEQTKEGEHSEEASVDGEEGVEEDDEFAILDDIKLKHTSMEAFTAITKDFKYYIQVQLGFKFKFRDEENEPEGEYVLPERLKSNIQSKVNEYIGTVTGGQIMAIPRDSINLILKEELKPLFRIHEIILKKVLLEQFIPAPVD